MAQYVHSPDLPADKIDEEELPTPQRVAILLAALGQEASSQVMKCLGPMRLSEVEQVQLRIVQPCRQLEEQGQITVVRGDASEQFV